MDAIEREVLQKRQKALLVFASSESLRQASARAIQKALIRSESNLRTETMNGKSGTLVYGALTIRHTP